MLPTNWGGLYRSPIYSVSLSKVASHGQAPSARDYVRKHDARSCQEKRSWPETQTGVSLGSDGFIPLRDNIGRASRSGVAYVAQPGHSVGNQDAIDACDQYGMVMAFTGTRLFHH